MWAERHADTLPEGPRPLYVGSEVFRRAAFGPHHPLTIVRHAAVMDLLRMLGWLSAEDYRESRAARTDELLEFHDRADLKALRQADSAGSVEPPVRERYRIGTFENPLFAGLYERAAMTVGGSILAAELALDGHVVFHPSGGTHHGRPDRAAGFCYLNDPVFAILTLLRQGRERVLYVDLDAHHGDGVEDAFYEDARVTTVSVHEQRRWPFSGTHSHPHAGAFNFSVPPGLNDDEFGLIVRDGLLPLAATIEADSLVLCCGADCLAGDPLSNMLLSNMALWDAIDGLLALGQPAVILGGGGYNPWTVTRYWAGLWGRISGKSMPAILPDEAQAYLRQMDCDLIDEEDRDEAWVTTLADAPSRGRVRGEVSSMIKEFRQCLAQAVIERTSA